MPKTVAELLTLLDLEQLDSDLFRGSQPATVLQRSFGGQVLAQALGAAYRSIPADRVAHSLNASFLRPGSTLSPILYVVEQTRDGGHFSSRRVVARQDGRPIFSMSCSFHLSEGGATRRARAARARSSSSATGAPGSTEPRGVRARRAAPARRR